MQTQMTSADRNLTVLLLGASGYIGSRWLQHPSDRVSKVIALVRDARADSVRGIKAPLGVSVVVREGTLPDVDPDELLDGVDIVLHFAGQLPHQADNGISEMHVEWTRRLAHACAQRGVKLLFPSTSSIYAGRERALLSEDTDEIEPRGAYAMDKYGAENMLRDIPHLSYAVVRLGSVFGCSAHMNTHTAVNAFVAKAARGEPIPVWRGVVDQMRPYTHIDDCIAALNFIIDHGLFGGVVYNVVSENETVRAILDHIRNHMPQSSTAIVDSDRANDLSYGMDDSRIRALGFAPQGTLRGGIDDLFQMYQKDIT